MEHSDSRSNSSNGRRGRPGHEGVVLAVVVAGGERAEVVRTGAAVASALRCTASVLDASRWHGEDVLQGVVARATAPGVTAVVMAARHEATAFWRVAERCPAALVGIPPGCDRTTVERVLLPLDGAPATSRAVADMVRTLATYGAHVTAVHVFDEATVPAFWDQPAHALPTWREEFLRRNSEVAHGLRVRSGSADRELLTEIRARRPDLVLMGWSQAHDPTRARVVRAALADGGAPVMLVPVD